MSRYKIYGVYNYTGSKESSYMPEIGSWKSTPSLEDFLNFLDSEGIEVAHIVPGETWTDVVTLVPDTSRRPAPSGDLREVGDYLKSRIEEARRTCEKRGLTSVDRVAMSFARVELEKVLAMIETPSRPLTLEERVGTKIVKQTLPGLVRTSNGLYQQVITLTLDNGEEIVARGVDELPGKAIEKAWQLIARAADEYARKNK